jgi:hypothetical protein
MEQNDFGYFGWACPEPFDFAQDKLRRRAQHRFRIADCGMKIPNPKSLVKTADGERE